MKVKARVFMNYVNITDESATYETSVLIFEGYTAEQALERHASEAEIKAKALLVHAERCRTAIKALDESPRKVSKRQKP